MVYWLVTWIGWSNYEGCSCRSETAGDSNNSVIVLAKIFCNCKRDVHRKITCFTFCLLNSCCPLNLFAGTSNETMLKQGCQPQEMWPSSRKGNQSRCVPVSGTTVFNQPECEPKSGIFISKKLWPYRLGSTTTGQLLMKRRLDNSRWNDDWTTFHETTTGQLANKKRLDNFWWNDS